jgi:uncharacterized delta-60 repeat protein
MGTTRRGLTMIQMFSAFRGRPLARCARIATAVSVLLFAGAGVAPVSAVPGDPDTTYGTGGFQSDVCDARDVARGLVIQPDGKLVIAGYAAIGGLVGNYFCVMRLNANGTLDSSFAGDGTYALGQQMSAYALALQPDGKTVTVGSAKVSDTNTDFFILRLNSAGEPDNSFNRFGTVQLNSGTGLDEATSVAVQPDGAIVVTGYCITFGSRFCTYRLTASGALDTTFGTNGRKDGAGGGGGSPTSVLIQPDGKIVVVGSCFGGLCIDRYNTDGSNDTSFAGTGTLNGPVYSRIGTAALQGDGSIVVATTCALPVAADGFGFCPTRIRSNGTIDPLMGSPITQFSGFSSIATSVVVQDDGVIAVAGTCTSGFDFSKKFCVARYNSDGSADRTFSADGRNILNTGLGDAEANAIVAQKDGKLVMAGSCLNGGTASKYCSVRLEPSLLLNRQCSLDIDGDGVVTTKDVLIANWFALDFQIIPLITAAGFTTSRVVDRFLRVQCGLGAAQ